MKENGPKINQKNKKYYIHPGVFVSISLWCLTPLITEGSVIVRPLTLLERCSKEQCPTTQAGFSRFTVRPKTFKLS